MSNVRQAAERVEQFLQDRSRAHGIDKEVLSSINGKDLLVSDLLTILDHLQAEEQS